MPPSSLREASVTSDAAIQKQLSNFDIAIDRHAWIATAGKKQKRQPRNDEMNCLR